MPELTILHTSDLHGQIAPHLEYDWPAHRPAAPPRVWTAGSLASLKTLFDRLRAERPGRVLAVDTGDTVQGSGIASLSAGRAIVPLMAMVGYDAMLPGNWEVVYGPQAFVSLMAAYSAPVIATNILDERSGAPLFHPYRVVTLGGVRIGLLGYDDPGIKTRQPPAYSTGIRLTDPLATLAATVRLLREQERADVVLMLAHLGLAQQVALADHEAARGVDFILGGDTHERVRAPLERRFSRVCEPGAFGSFVGRLDLTIEGGRLARWRYELLPVDLETYPPDPQVQAAIASAIAPHAGELGRVLGHSLVPLARYSVLETPIDNLIADAIREATACEIAVSNGFRFGVPVPAGPFTVNDLWNFLPVDSRLKTGRVTGAQLLDWLETEIEHVFVSDPARRFGGWMIRPSGLSVRFRARAPFGERLVDVRVAGEPLDPGRTYALASYWREGEPEDQVSRVRPAQDARVWTETLHQAVAQYMRRHSPVEPSIEGRVVAEDMPVVVRTPGGIAGYEFW